METGEPWRAYDESPATADGTRVFMRTAKVPLRDAAGRMRGPDMGAYEWINNTELAPVELLIPRKGFGRSRRTPRKPLRWFRTGGWHT